MDLKQSDYAIRKITSREYFFSNQNYLQNYVLPNLPNERLNMQAS